MPIPSKFSFNKRKIILGSLLVIFFLILRYALDENTQNPVAEEINKVTHTPKTKSAKIITFGEWKPEGKREILGKVTSEGDNIIKADISGTIEKIWVNLGDRVKKGQLLAQYKNNDNLTYINYQNALNQLKTTESTNQQNFQTSKLNLLNSKVELEKIIDQQTQNKRRSYQSLITTIETSKTSMIEVLNFLDSQLGATNLYRTEGSPFRNQIGDRNAALKQSIKADTESLVKTTQKLYIPTLSILSTTNLDVARSILNFLKETQRTLSSYDDLLGYSIISPAFTETNRQSIRQQISGFQNQINGAISQLNNQIESFISTQKNDELSLVTTRNRIKNIEQNLKLVESQNYSQRVSAQSQLNLMKASQKDLKIYAPFDGNVSEIYVFENSQISPGNQILRIVSESSRKKITTYLSLDEWESLKSNAPLTVRVQGENISISSTAPSTQMNQQTQKFLVEIYPEPNQQLIIGSVAKILIGIDESNNFVLPISAISFEIDGPEVLILDKNNKVIRNDISVGDVIADSIKIPQGLEKGAKVLKFYKQAFPGEIIKPLES